MTVHRDQKKLLELADAFDQRPDDVAPLTKQLRLIAARIGLDELAHRALVRRAQEAEATAASAILRCHATERAAEWAIRVARRTEKTER